jgi:hypothetical protein
MGKEGRADVLPEPSSGQTVEHGTRLILNMLSSLMFATLSLFVIVLFRRPALARLWPGCAAHVVGQ